MQELLSRFAMKLTFDEKVGIQSPNNSNSESHHLITTVNIHEIVRGEKNALNKGHSAKSDCRVAGKKLQ